MNFLSCRIDGNEAVVGEHRVPLSMAQAEAAAQQTDGDFKLGIRPEFVTLAEAGQGLPAQVRASANMGEFHLLTLTMAGYELKMRLPNEQPLPEGDECHITFPAQWLCLYGNERLIGDEV